MTMLLPAKGILDCGRWWTVDRYASTGKVHLFSLWPWPLTTKC